MRKAQLWIIIGSLALIVILYSLPTYVVENDKLETGEKLSSSTTEQSTKDHSNISAVDQANIGRWSTMVSGGISEKNIIFADSLARCYLKYGYTDSLIAVVEDIKAMSTSSGLLIAGQLLFSASQVSGNESERQRLMSSAKELLEPYVKDNPKNLSAKAKLAMTLVNSSNPMQGVMMLREVLQEDESNVEALYFLGLLSIQSSQFDKAVARFNMVTSLEPTNWTAWYYLGIAQKELEDVEGAKNSFQMVNRSNDVFLMQMAEEQLLSFE